MKRPSRLCIVLPCYNEALIIASTVAAVECKLRECEEAGLIQPGSMMLFVDDGSIDMTWSSLTHIHSDNSRVHAIKFAANRGKEYALYAGLMEARNLADIVICMDADLQHDLDAVNEFLRLYHEGYDLVYGVKLSRGREAFYKKVAAPLFYGIVKRLGSPVIKDHTDYSLMTSQVIEALSEYKENNMMFRAILCSLGFRQCPCYFHVQDRAGGSSKFSARMLIGLSVDAITSFSVVPLRMIGWIGVAVFLVSVVMVLWVVVAFFRGHTPSGWATITCSLWFLGGLGMIGLAVLGEYLGKMYMETKKRPRYFIEKRIPS